MMVCWSQGPHNQGSSSSACSIVIRWFCFEPCYPCEQRLFPRKSITEEVKETFFGLDRVYLGSYRTYCTWFVFYSAHLTLKACLPARTPFFPCCSLEGSISAILFSHLSFPSNIISIPRLLTARTRTTNEAFHDPLELSDSQRCPSSPRLTHLPLSGLQTPHLTTAMRTCSCDRLTMCVSGCTKSF